MARLKKYFKAYLLIGYAFLLLLHFVIKDHIFPISTLYYSCPLPMIICFGVLAMLFFLRQKKKFYVILVSIAILLGYWFTCYYATLDQEISVAKPSKIMFWNVSNKEQFPVDIVVNQVQEHKPNIIAFVETIDITEQESQRLKNTLPNYDFRKLYGGMYIGIKGKIESVDYTSEAESYKINLVTATIGNTTQKFIVTDIYAYPFYNKKPPLDMVLETALKANVNYIVGDFNTPYESVHFQEYRNNYTSFHDYNTGFTATWPVGIPLYEIDHIWMDASATPIILEKTYYQVSDHALLIGSFIRN